MYARVGALCCLTVARACFFLFVFFVLGVSTAMAAACSSVTKRALCPNINSEIWRVLIFFAPVLTRKRLHRLYPPTNRRNNSHLRHTTVIARMQHLTTYCCTIILLILSYHTKKKGQHSTAQHSKCVATQYFKNKKLAQDFVENVYARVPPQNRVLNREWRGPRTQQYLLFRALMTPPPQHDRAAPHTTKKKPAVGAPRMSQQNDGGSGRARFISLERGAPGNGRRRYP